MKRTIYTPRRKPNKKWADQRKTPLLKVILGILGLVAGAYIGGQIAGYIDFWRRPQPSHYIVPVENLRDIKVRDMKIQEGEWEWAEKHGEILRGNRLVTQAYAKEEPVSVEDKIRAKFGEYGEQAISCFKRESGLRVDALNTRNRNGSWDMGLAQINTVHCSKVGASDREDCKNKLFDIDTNLEVAKGIFDASGWRPWYACKHLW